MGKRDERVDAYIEQAADFARPMLERIREDFHKASARIEEDIKWGVPAFVHEGLVGGMAAFKGHVGFGFWRVKELPDPDGLFPGDKAGSPFRYKAREPGDLPTRKVLQAYVKRAVALNRERAAAPAKGRGKQAATKRARRPAPRTPPDLAAALDEHPKAKAVYEAFPPSARRDYVTWITGARREATRARRLATTIEWLEEGKRRNWKYESC